MMAQLWINDGRSDAQRPWTLAPLEATSYQLQQILGSSGDRRSADRSDRPAPILQRSRRPETGRPGWVVLTPLNSDLRVNGRPVPGIRLLNDRDQLQCAEREPVYFTTYRAARVESYQGPTGASCPRCLAEIEPDRHSVRCPSCAAWHHEDADRPCWSYAEHCGACDQPTNAEAGPPWSPENL